MDQKSQCHVYLERPGSSGFPASHLGTAPSGMDPAQPTPPVWTSQPHPQSSLTPKSTHKHFQECKPHGTTDVHRINKKVAWHCSTRVQVVPVITLYCSYRPRFLPSVTNAKSKLELPGKKHQSEMSSCADDCAVPLSALHLSSNCHQSSDGLLPTMISIGCP